MLENGLTVEDFGGKAAVKYLFSKSVRGMVNFNHEPHLYSVVFCGTLAQTMFSQCIINCLKLILKLII